MPQVRFTVREAELLYSIPKPPTELETIVRCFMFINRAAPPTFEELTSCLTKGVKAGIIQKDNGKFAVEGSWYNKIHAADETAENEIESMLEFEEWFVDHEFPERDKTSHVLTLTEFDNTLKALS